MLSIAMGLSFLIFKMMAVVVGFQIDDFLGSFPILYSNMFILGFCLFGWLVGFGGFLAMPHGLWNLSSPTRD